MELIATLEVMEKKEERFQFQAMDSISQVCDIDDNMKVKLSSADNFANNESRKIQQCSSKFSSTLANVNSSDITFENSADLEGTSCMTPFQNNLVCEKTEPHSDTFLTEHMNGIYESIRENMEVLEEDMIKVDEKCDTTDETLKQEASCINPVNVSEVVTSQDCTGECWWLCASSSHDNEPNLHMESKIKRSISKGQSYANSGISMERSDASSDEDSNKRQKLNKSVHATSSGNMSDDVIMFQRTKSKIKQRNYRKRRNIASDNEDSSGNTLSNETTSEASMFDTGEGNCQSVY